MADQTTPFAKSEILPFFPSLVWRFRLPDEDAAAVNALVIRKGEELAGHLKGEHDSTFMQTHQKLHRDPDMAPLSRHIIAASSAVMHCLLYTSPSPRD